MYKREIKIEFFFNPWLYNSDLTVLELKLPINRKKSNLDMFMLLIFF
jgi:hypothetical protein